MNSEENTPMQRVSAILLAAGQSKRMGRDKLYLEYKGETFLSHTLKFMQSFDFFEKIVVTSAHTAKHHPFPEDFQVIINDNRQNGLSTSVQRGVTAASGDGYLFFMVDQPFLSHQTVLDVLDAATDHTIVIPSGNRGMGVYVKEGQASPSPGNPVFFAKAFKEHLLASSGDKGGREVRDKFPDACRYVQVKNPKELMDIDTIEQYHTAIASTNSRAG